ncbi:zinc-binding dehydrogenase [Actinospongicola halichondriae]|uniref:zinc-binding dehydrogenase n=1 Tax=Actinospongicola halichondriae TaxID=3236844 RepID=UPI003D5AE8A9
MHAVTIADKALNWSTRPDPVPGVGEVLVRVRAAGINSADRLQVMGFYPAPPGSPADIPGLELAGTVEALGPDVTGWSEGDRVMAVVGGGAMAELAVVHERHLLPVPSTLSWEQAGGFAETYTTAHDALFTQVGLSMGERVCIHGAAGGVGTAAVQLAAAAGCVVTATVRNESLRDAVHDLGADVVIDPADFVDAGPFDVILELVGAPNWPGNITALAPWGRIMIIGVGAGPTTELSLLDLMQKRATIRASTLRARPLEEKAAAAQAMIRHVLPGAASGDLTVPIEATFPMASVDEAFDRFAAGGKLGKIVLTLD